MSGINRLDSIASWLPHGPMLPGLKVAVGSGHALRLLLRQYKPMNSLVSIPNMQHPE